jgi:AcrR family transcriptional regulator
MNHDLRFIRTEQAIRNSFFDCLKEETFQEISIIELVKRAQIGRPTFYQHYEDKYALASNLMNHYLANFHDLIKKRMLVGQINAPLESLAQYLITNREQINLLLQIQLDNGDTLMKKYEQVLKVEFINAYQNNSNTDWTEIPLNYATDLYVAIALVFIKHTLSTGDVNLKIINGLNALVTNLNSPSRD